ncbi:MAG: Gfo/Idh/MocA family protein [Candidatus Hodarchaeales archaeon]|jgi:predicted dehydrogenase
MKIGIVGLGSIGQRHARCLQKLGVTDTVALRTGKGTKKELNDDLKYIKVVFDKDDFYSLNLEGVIIANPTSFHVESMKSALEYKIPILIEKPIASTLESIEILQNYDLSKIQVGYCLRYDELINVVKDFIDSNRLGRIFKAHLYIGHYLPFWHPYADYRTEYYSRKDLGGGALRTLSHEIDLIRYFFGNVKELFANVEKLSQLQIDVDDNVHIFCKMNEGSRILVELDYLNPTYQRTGRILGEEGELRYSFSEKKASFIDLNSKTHIIYENHALDPNEMYLNQIKDFIDLIKEKTRVRCTFDDGVEVMKIIKSAEDSSRLKEWQKIE